MANWQVWSTLTGASCLLIAGTSSYLAGLVHPHWSFLPPHCRYVVFSCRSGPPSQELPASSLQVCRLIFLQVWSTLIGASCLLIAGMSSFLLAGLVHPHWSFLPPHCRYVVFSSCRSGPPSVVPPASSLQVGRIFFWQVWSTLTGASCLLIAGMLSYLLPGLVHPHWILHLLMAGRLSFLAGLVHPHWSFLPPHCRYVVLSSCRSGPPSLEPPPPHGR